MKSLALVPALLTGILTASVVCQSAAQGQTVGSQYPAGQSFVISSSPTNSGGVITTTYLPPHSPQPVRQAALQSTTTMGAVPAQGLPVQQFRPQQPVGTSVLPGSPSQPPSMPGAQPATALPPNYPTSNVATHGTVQTVQSTAGVNPYVGLPLPTTTTNRVVTYNNPQGVPPANCQPVGVIPANAPPTLAANQLPQTVPVTQNYRPLVPVRGLPGGSYVSQGLWGNPRAYVNGQPVRNFWRYIIF